MKTKPITYFKRLSPTAENVKIMVGNQAWDFAKAGEMARNANEIELDQTLTANTETPLVIANLEAFVQFVDEGGLWRMLPRGAYSVTVQRCNNAVELSDLEIATLQNQLGKQNSKALYFNYIDEAGFPLADWSETVKNIAKRVKTAPKEKEANKSLPYIEKRLEGDLESLFLITPKLDKDTGEKTGERLEWLSDVIEVVGRGIGEEEQFLIFQSIDNPLLVPLADIGEREGWAKLRAHGLTVTSKPRLKSELADYLQQQSRKALNYTVTSATGWSKDRTAFVMPDGSILKRDNSKENHLIFHKQSDVGGYTVQGTAAEWAEKVGRLAVGNPSMMLAVGVALSAPLLSLFNLDSYGVHLFEDSTHGKTTTLNLASSIYGKPKEITTKWNATALALQNIAYSKNDLFMPLDEISESTPKSVSQTAYSLFNGQGKAQGAKDGGNRAMKRWTIANLSTGEMDLESYLLQNGIKSNAGQLVRLLNIPMRKAVEFHELTGGKEHADLINENANRYFGAMGIAWIKWLLNANHSQLMADFEEVKKYRLSLLPDDCEGQIKRVVADRFSVIQTALMLAKPLLGWTDESIEQAINATFNDWVSEHGWGSKKHAQIIDQVNGYLLANQDSGFFIYPTDGNQKQLMRALGYRDVSAKADIFYVYPFAFDEAIKGQSKTLAIKTLITAKMLTPENEKQVTVKIPFKIDKGRRRAYKLTYFDE